MDNGGDTPDSNRQRCATIPSQTALPTAPLAEEEIFPTCTEVTGNVINNRENGINNFVKFNNNKNAAATNESHQLDGSYVERSFCFVPINNRFRRRAIALIESKWLGHVSLIVTFVNCICLGFLDSCDFNCIAPRCQLLQFVDLGIFAFFVSEMFLKMLAMGVIGKQSFLSHPWNIFDFLIIAVGSTELVYGKGAVGLSSVRTFRVLRPLRAINRIPSLKILVELLLESLPMLSNVLLFAFFIFFVFGICGIQLWAGILRHRCFFPLDSPDFMTWVSEQNLTHALEEMPPHYRRPSGGDYVCTPHFGMLRCEDIYLHEQEGSICDQVFHDEESVHCRILVLNYTECRPFANNPSRETVGFDNIGEAWIAIFQVINLESWTEVMYYLQDAYSFWVWIYFFILIVIGTFFALNLCLVVIANHFQEAKRRTSSITSSLPADSSIYLQLLDLIGLGLQQCVYFVKTICFRCETDEQKQQRRQQQGATDRRGGLDVVTNNEQIDLFLTVGSFNISLTAEAHPNGSVPVDNFIIGEQQRSHRKRKSKIISSLRFKVYTSRTFLRSMFEHNAVAILIMGVIFLNTLIMGTEHHLQPEKLTVVIENINVAFTCFFAAELLLKLYAYGFTTYIHDGFNMLDLIVVVVNLFELTHGTGSGFFVLRAFRLVRLVKIIRFLPGLQRQLLIMLKTVDNVASFFLLVSLFLFIFAIMGMSLFGCQYCPALNKYMVPEFKRLENRKGDLELNDTLIFDLPVNVTKDLSPQADDSDHTHDIELVSHFICPRTNFDTLPSSLFTVLQVFTQDSWTAVLKDGMTVTSRWSSLYFVGLVSIGSYILLNLLVAILVEGFSSSENDSSFSEEINRDTSYHDTFFTLPAKSAPLASTESLSDSVMGTSVITDEVVMQGAALASCRSSIRALSWNFCCGFGSFLEKRREYAFFLLPPDNFLRKHLTALVTSRYFDNMILCFIFFNCLVITMERPSIKKDSNERRLIDIGNSAINLIFSSEAVLKIVANGFIIGNTAYLRDNWNVLDFLLVTFSSAYAVVEMFFSDKVEEAKILEILRVLRLLRALRPLRVVNRAPGLKIVVETLLLSVKPIGNIIVITSAFFLIFAILGVQMFRGCFYKCVVAGTKYVSSRHKNAHHGAHQASESEMLTFESLLEVKNSSDCSKLGATFEWENESYNFDNIGNGLMTLFVFATFDGWVDITRAGLDCVGVDQQPEFDHNPWRILYFLSFLLIVCFFVVNMFVGVVVTNFEKVHRRVLAEKEAKRRRAKRMTIPTDNRSPAAKKILKADNSSNSLNQISITTEFSNPPSLNLATATRQRRLGLPVNYPQVREIRKVLRRNALLNRYLRCRLRMYRLFTHKYFEIILVGITTFNVLIMAVEYYQMPKELMLAIKTISYAFTVLLLIELLMKIIVMGTRRCFRDKWTQLDLFILAASLVEIAFEDTYTRLIPINPTIFRLLRLVRIARAFRLLKTAKGVRRLLDTVSEALPKVAHLSVVFFLLFFIYASLGVELFGKFSCPYAKCGGLSRHASFEHFGMAMLTLFRIFTGDKWNGILKDMLHVSGDAVYCHKLLDSKFENVGFECRTAGYTAPLYFVSFVLATRFVLINVVVAVLMSQLQQSQHEEQDDSCIERQNLKRKFRNNIAPPNTMYNSREELVAEMNTFYRSGSHLGTFVTSLSSPHTLMSDSSYGSNPINLYRYRQQPSHFSLSGVQFGRDVSLHLIDESPSPSVFGMSAATSFHATNSFIINTIGQPKRRRMTTSVLKSVSQHFSLVPEHLESCETTSTCSNGNAKATIAYRLSRKYPSVPTLLTTQGITNNRNNNKLQSTAVPNPSHTKNSMKRTSSIDSYF